MPARTRAARTPSPFATTLSSDPPASIPRSRSVLAGLAGSLARTLDEDFAAFRPQRPREQQHAHGAREYRHHQRAEHLSRRQLLAHEPREPERTEHRARTAEPVRPADARGARLVVIEDRRERPMRERGAGRGAAGSNAPTGPAPATAQ